MLASIRRSGRRPDRWALLAAAVLLASACGGQLSDREILAANGATTGAGRVDQRASTNEPVAGTPSSTTVLGPATGSASASGSASVPGAATAAASPSANDASAAPGPDAPSTPGETGPIVIGSVGNYSGPAGAAQSGIPKGVQVWAASVNARGGLFGRQVQVIVKDDGGDPARYSAAVQDLVENRHVVAFVGNGAALSMQGGSDYLNKKGVPVIGTECGVVAWYQSNVYFPQCADYPSQVAALVKIGVRLTGKLRVGYVFCGEATACTSFDPMMQAGIEKAGAQLVYRAQISLTQVDFTANCNNAKNAGVELMTVAADPNTLARFARSCDRQRFHPQYTQPSVSVTGDSVRLPGLSTMALESPVFPFTGVSGGAFDEYNRAVRDHLGAPTGPATAFGWAAAKLFELGATRAALAAHSLTSATLLAAMHTIKNETLGGLTVPLDFTGQTPNPAHCGFAMQGDGNGGWTVPLGTKPVCV